MTPVEFWVKAAQWGSYMTNSDPGACMYGFDERGAVQCEEHRKACIEYLDVKCREMVNRRIAEQDVMTAEDAEGGTLQEIDDLIAYLKTAPNVDYFRDNPVRAERYRK